MWLYTFCWVLVLSSWLVQDARWALHTLMINTNFPMRICRPRPYCASITSGSVSFRVFQHPRTNYYKKLIPYLSKCPLPTYDSKQCAKGGDKNILENLFSLCVHFGVPSKQLIFLSLLILKECTLSCCLVLQNLVMVSALKGPWRQNGWLGHFNKMLSFWSPARLKFWKSIK